VKRTIEGMIQAGEPLMNVALEDMRAYHRAQDSGAPAEEVERLRLIAESSFKAVTDYQLYALGHQSLIRH
jgi:hypothetical protein